MGRRVLLLVEVRQLDQPAKSWPARLCQWGANSINTHDLEGAAHGLQPQAFISYLSLSIFTNGLCRNALSTKSATVTQIANKHTPTPIAVFAFTCVKHAKVLDANYHYRSSGQLPSTLVQGDARCCSDVPTSFLPIA